MKSARPALLFAMPWGRCAPLLEALLLLSLAAGCGPTGEAQADLSGDHQATADGTPRLAEVAGPDEESSFQPADFRPGEFIPEEGGFLWPCVDGQDCISTFCLATEVYGQVCTVYCEEECPLNWKCQSKNVGADIIFLCTPPESDLCRPCTRDKECGTPDDRCLELTASEQRYCSLACQEDSDCPKDYGCVDLPTPEGESYTGCRPLSGSCICLGELFGASRPCVRTNEFGKCFGEEHCDGPEGWGQCSAVLPAAEICDGQDNDCNGQFDDQLEPPPCEQTNEWGTCLETSLCLGKEGWNCPAHTPAEELCDGLDNDCDGDIDESDPLLGDECDSPDDEDLCPNGKLTCDPQVHEIVCAGDGATPELCDGLDNNCDGETDEGFPDSDDDGVADCIDLDDDEDGDPDLSDCAPNDPAVYNGASELCNGKDENCNQAVDEGYPDGDDDGLADCIDPDDDDDGFPDAADCAPLDPDLFPGAIEKCNGKDDNCDGKTDPEGALGCKMWYIDADKDGFGFDGLSQCVCGGGGTPPYTAFEGGDCNDSSPAVNPMAEELCDSLDNNCDGDVDNIGAAGCATRYLDQDKDGFGVTWDKACVCGTKGFYTATVAGDCNDEDKTVFPGATEYCNSKDDNCNFQADEEGAAGCNNYYIDQDKDGFGVTGSLKCLCGPIASFTAQKGGDCADTDPDRNPGKIELCGDSKDNNCNGDVDEANCTWP